MNNKGLSHLKNKDLETMSLNSVVEEDDYNKQQTKSFHAFGNQLRGVSDDCHVFNGMSKGLEEVIQNAKSAWDNDFEKGDKNNHVKVLIEFYKDVNGDIRCIIANTGKESQNPLALLQQMLDFGNSKQEGITNVNGVGLKAFLSYCFSPEAYKNGDFVIATKKGNTLYYKSAPYSEYMEIKEENMENIPLELREYTTFVDTKIDKDLLKELNPTDLINRLGSLCGIAIQNDELEISFNMSIDVQKDIAEISNIAYKPELMRNVDETVKNTLSQSYSNLSTIEEAAEVKMDDDETSFKSAEYLGVRVSTESLKNENDENLDIEDDKTIPVNINNIFINENNNGNKELNSDAPYYKTIFTTDNLWDRATAKIGHYLFMDGFMQTYLGLKPIDRNIHQSLCGCFTYINLPGHDGLNKRVSLKGIETYFSNLKTRMVENGALYNALKKVCKNNETFYRYIATLDTEKNARNFGDIFFDAMAQLYNLPYVKEMPNGRNGFMDAAILKGDGEPLYYKDGKNLEQKKLNQMMRNGEIHARTIIEYKRDAITRQDVEQLINYININGIDNTEEAYLFGLNITTDAYNRLIDAIVDEPKLGMIRFGFYDASQLAQIGFTRQSSKECFQDYALYKLYMDAQPQSEEEKNARIKIKEDYGYDMLLTKPMGEYMEKEIAIAALDKQMRILRYQGDPLFESNVINPKIIISEIKNVIRYKEVSANMVTRCVDLAKEMFVSDDFIINTITNITNGDKNQINILSGLLFGNILEEIINDSQSVSTPLAYFLKHYDNKTLKGKIKEISLNYKKIEKYSNVVIKDIKKNVSNDNYKCKKMAEIDYINNELNSLKQIDISDENVYFSTREDTIKFLENKKEELQEFLDCRDFFLKNTVPNSVVTSVLSNFNVYSEINKDLANKENVESILSSRINDAFYEKYTTIKEMISMDSEFKNPKLQKRILESIFMDNTTLITKEYINKIKNDIRDDAIEETKNALQQKYPKIEDWMLDRISAKIYSCELNGKVIKEAINDIAKEHCREIIGKIFNTQKLEPITDIINDVHLNLKGKKINQEKLEEMNLDDFEEKCRLFCAKCFIFKREKINEILQQMPLYSELNKSQQREICSSLAVTHKLKDLEKDNAKIRNTIMTHIIWKSSPEKCKIIER